MTKTSSLFSALLLVIGSALSCTRGAAIPATIGPSGGHETPLSPRSAQAGGSGDPRLAAGATLHNDVEARQMAELEVAAQLYEEFIARAGDDPEYAEAVARSRERVEDINAIRVWWEQGRREQPAPP